RPGPSQLRRRIVQQRIGRAFKLPALPFLEQTQSVLVGSYSPRPHQVGKSEFPPVRGTLRPALVATQFAACDVRIVYGPATEATGPETGLESNRRCRWKMFSVNSSVPRSAHWRP